MAEKQYKLSDYLNELAKGENTEKEDQFLIVQNRIHKNLSKDVMDLLNSLEANGIPAPKDFVFMTYFALFWSRMKAMYKNDKEKQDIINLFNNIMSDDLKPDMVRETLQ